MFEKIFVGCNGELKQKIIKNIIFGKDEKKEPNYDYMKSLGTFEEQKNYLEEILMFNISNNGIIKKKNLDNNTISKICGMILDIGSIDEIFEITKNEQEFLFCVEQILLLLHI